ncbi:GNAT family N-acetyltransferase [Paenilisteria rocourtiae]|uniref:Ribosomal protein S18 acetylase RimI-like enzyme n=1 Tax=Listeria rocourtiae TaxID=647910 RepID=A0A4R6ZK69_9LIST|nr:GNAT family N-acetyltransferase [Listeria rocourtiae]EUJ47811.1 acetyltransferase family protein [Listeria rocourtiae FSL F6-920]MBC1435053.1 GNAT family N-acetyltransferase [Listeria rocourtiae]MBC1604542.1 GNAT family N-acetyltransferase [Listeria rocourtiae]TDR52635.1 ribosomal protein S18 acetylase RimI-like enzyme [Listeria rocourtiae]
MHIKIAKSKEDSQHISELAHYIWHEHYPSIITKEQIDYMLKKFQSADTIYSEIENGTTYLMAYKSTTFVGYAAFYQKGAELFLSKLYINPAYHKQGIGKQLFAEIIQFAQNNNLPSIRLFVNKYNTNSIEAYKKMGFSVEKALITDVGGGFIMDDYTMTYTV